MKESEKKDKYLDLASELKKLKVMVIPIIISALGSHQRMGTRTGGLGNERMGTRTGGLGNERMGTRTGGLGNERMGTRTGGLRNKRMGKEHPNYNIFEIDLNTEKSPADLRSLKLL